MRALLVAVTVPFLLSGCFGMCPLHYPGATWHEPGIYEALEGMSPEENLGPGLPFAHPVAGLGNLTAVAWQTRGGPGLVSGIALHPNPEGAFAGSVRDGVRLIDGLAGPTITVTADNLTSTETLRTAFATFLRNVTAADEQQILLWSDKGATQSEEAGSVWYGEDQGELKILAFRVSVDGPFRLELLYNETKAAPQASDYAGFEWHNGGDWGFRFYYRERNALLPNGVTASADPRDIVTVWVRGEPPNGQRVFGHHQGRFPCRWHRDCGTAARRVPAGGLLGFTHRS